ncbi:MAG: hypothetical protein CMM38_01985 [Rhodospirillaceae bacterium]|nr:hypothetical protein [Rhodospirillaceae bacterium]|tara:strand:- start:22083 stop:22955 length:873 start_codon:yes stop_codon:yes gene_type:complete
MILISGANGAAGRSVIKHLVKKGLAPRALVSNNKSADEVMKLGARPFVGDMRDVSVQKNAMDGISTIYHIAPGLIPNELCLSRNFIASAKALSIDRFILHGVSYPYAPDIEFHWTKMKLEAELLLSGLQYTIIRPTQFMQNIIWSLPQIIATGEFGLPYSPNISMGFVDVDDLGKAVSKVLTEKGHSGATYELCSIKKPINRHDIAVALTEAFGVRIRATRCSFDDLRSSHFFSSLSKNQLQELSNMYDHIDQFGTAYFNNEVLEMLTGEPSTNYYEFAKRLPSIINSMR